MFYPGVLAFSEGGFIQVFFLSQREVLSKDSVFLRGRFYPGILSFSEGEYIQVFYLF
jgi:hypothetical protein